MNHTTKTTTRLGIVTAIAAVTLVLLVTVGIVVVVSMMMPVQHAKAAASNCISSPNSKSVACSGSGGSRSCSTARTSASCVNPQSTILGGSRSASADSKGVHFSFSCGKGSTSTNIPGTTISSGKGCP